MTDARNIARGAALQAARPPHEGRAVDADWFKDEWTSVDTWAMLREEHGSKPKTPFDPRAAMESLGLQRMTSLVDVAAAARAWRRRLCPLAMV